MSPNKSRIGDFSIDCRGCVRLKVTTRTGSIPVVTDYWCEKIWIGFTPFPVECSGYVKTEECDNQKGA